MVIVNDELVRQLFTFKMLDIYFICGLVLYIGSVFLIKFITYYDKIRLSINIIILNLSMSLDQKTAIQRATIIGQRSVTYNYVLKLGAK